MKKQIVATASALLLVGVLAGCEGGGTYVGNTYVPNRTIGAGVGAVGGGLLGAAVSRGNPWATVGGAAIGGVTGYYVGKSTERRYYRRY